MTVGELKKKLEEFPDDAECMVIENGFYEIEGLQNVEYEEFGDGSKEVFFRSSEE